MPRTDWPEDPERDRRRAIAAANSWYPSEGGLRDVLAVALAAATVIGAAMVFSVAPVVAAMARAEMPAGDRVQFYIAFGSLLGAPALGWLLWRGRRHAFATGMLVVFALSVGALLPLARG